MADIKLTSLPLGGAVTGQDILYLVQNPGTTPTSVKVTVFNLLQMVSSGASPHAVTHRPGGPDVLVNNAWTDQANVFTQGQTIQQAAGPQLKIIDTGQVVDSRMWRIQNIGTQLNFLASNDAITVNASVFALHRDGRLVMPDTTTGYIQFGTTGVGAPTAGTRSVGTKLVLYPRATTPGEVDYALGIEGGSLWYSTPLLSGVHRWYGGTTQQMTLTNNNLTVVGSITGGALSCTTINTNGNTITTGSIAASGRQTITGGSATGYNTAPLEIMLASHPRVAFHWPGQVASQLGMDVNGVIRTYDNPGTGYAPFACGALNANGNIVSQHITCWNVNTQGSDVTTGTATVTSAARIGNIRIQGDDATNNGYPWIRAAPGAHMVINGNPLYLNLDWAGPVLVYGAYVTLNPPVNCASTLSCAGFSCHAITTNGNAITSGAITCTNINTQGYNVTTGTLNVSGQVWVGASHSYGADNSQSISTGPITAAAINCHGITCHGINTQGNAIMSGGISYMGHLRPVTSAAGYNLGDMLYKWSGLCMSIGAVASGLALVTDSSGWTFYVSSERDLKRDIEPLTLTHAQGVLSKLTPYRYRDVKDTTNGPKVVGFMVEDAMDAGLDELVGHYNDKPAGIYYERIAVYLSMVVKDMERRINELEARLN